MGRERTLKLDGGVPRWQKDEEEAEPPHEEYVYDSNMEVTGGGGDTPG